MAFFKFRKGGDEPSAAPVQPESVEVMRRRAQHRLIGAAVLVLVGVIGFPMLFDKQQRPIAVDTPIEIPDRNKAKPLSIPAPGPAVVSARDRSSDMIIEEKELEAPVAAEYVAPKIIAKKEQAPLEKPAEKHLQKPVTKVDDGAKAQALLEARTPDKKPAVIEGRFVVQIGAFADADRAHEVRLKVERAGLKTYIHVAQTKDGARTRVRVGPFGTKAEADKAAEKIKNLGLSAGILVL